MVWPPGCGWLTMRTAASVEHLSTAAAQTVGNLISLYHGQRLHCHLCLCSFLMKSFCFKFKHRPNCATFLCSWNIYSGKKIKCTLWFYQVRSQEMTAHWFGVSALIVSTCTASWSGWTLSKYSSSAQCVVRNGSLKSEFACQATAWHFYF